ncbi:hypothetical protein M3Y97_00691200 [Aphelenchoides bicaudatus]|nr:hypothetical protein M3Y97_00691200 [Aphelenchoides bicaudatus]
MINAYLYLFILFAPQIILAQYEWALEHQNRLVDQIKCKACQTVLDQLKDRLPNLVALGKQPLKLALMSACSGLSAVAMPLLIPVCIQMSGPLADLITDEIAKNADGLDPRQSCEKVGMCPEC